MAEHTPTPWRLGHIQPWNDMQEIKAPGDDYHALVAVDTPRGEADAEFIIRACNSHEKLLEAAREVLAQSQDFGAVHPEAIEELFKVIHRAEGKLLDPQ